MGACHTMRVPTGTTDDPRANCSKSVDLALQQLYAVTIQVPLVLRAIISYLSKRHPIPSARHAAHNPILLLLSSLHLLVI